MSTHARTQREHREVGGDACQVLVGGLLADALEELPDLPAPPVEVSAQDRRLGAVVKLLRPDVLDLPAEPQLRDTGGTDVADPLRRPPRGDEVALAVDV